MKCLRCGHKNNATVAYCAKCGGKLNMTADEIRDALVQKAQEERAMATEHYARQALFFASIVFAIALTLVFAVGGAQTECTAVPSVVNGTKYLEMTYNVKDSLKLPLGRVPFSSKR
ncbi:MAG: zinc ribbon domain-containing protein [Planctomycetes bacterium]|nr:zinc ribbon domain-containing protein [Planctomycetota bacterium]